MSHLPPEQGLEIGQLHSQGGTWSTRPALLRQFSGAWELVFLVTERPGLYQGKETQGSSSPCQGWAHSWPAGAAHISLFRLMTLEGHSSFRTVQKLHQVPLWFCLTAGESSPIPKECEDRHQRAGSGMHFPPRKAERVGEDATSPSQASLYLWTPSPWPWHGLFSGKCKGDVFSAGPSRCSHYTSNKRLSPHKEHKSTVCQQAQIKPIFSVSIQQPGENGCDSTIFYRHPTPSTA